MDRTDLFKIFSRVVTGRYPMLSIEVTRECPLRCPGCYAYDPGHLGEEVGPLRTLADYKGRDLVDGIMNLVRRHRPVHVSLVGGEPLVRFRELNEVLPQLSALGIEVLLVTSAVRPIPAHWTGIDNLHIAVSIDGLQPEHDARRKPATYDRILKHIKDVPIRVHCTITPQIARPGYLEAFSAFRSNQPEVRKIWFSLFTPQIGADDQEILPPAERAAVLDELNRLRGVYRKIHLPSWVLEGFRHPPASPDDCLFARTTLSYTADLEHRITPCQFGGEPDCSQCGCMASAGLKAVGDMRLLGVMPIRSLYHASHAVGKRVGRALG